MSSSSKKRPMLFLDRDEGVNVEKNNLYRIDDSVFIDGICDHCRHGDYNGRRGSDYQAGLSVVSTLNLSPNELSN